MDDLTNALVEAVRLGDADKLLVVRLRIARHRSRAWQELLEQRAKSLRPKDKDVTELDRKVLMDALSAEKERDYQLLESLWEIVRTMDTDALARSRADTGSGSFLGRYGPKPAQPL